MALVAGDGGDAHHGLIVRRLGAPRLADPDVALAADHRYVDHVHRSQGRRQQARQRDRGQRLYVELGDVALVGDLDRRDRRLDELADEAAELLGEIHVRTEPHRLLRRDRRHVDGVGNGTREQEVGHLLGDLHRDVFLRLAGRRAEMRRRHDIVATEQDVLLGRLDREYVERRARDLAGIQRRLEVFLDDEAAARAIDDAYAVFHLRDRGGADDVARLVGQRRVQRDEVGAREQLVELDLLDAENHGALRRQEWI